MPNQDEVFDASAPTLQERIGQLAEQMSDRIRSGFHQLQSLEASQRERFLDTYIPSIADGTIVPPNELSDLLGTDPSKLPDIPVAIGATLGSLFDLEATPEEFLEHAAGKLYDEEDKAAARLVAVAIASRRGDLTRFVKETSLADTVLPSLSRTLVEVDLRVRFRGKVLEQTAPVAIVHIDTDIDGAHLWFQVNKIEMRKLIQQLEEAEEKMALAGELGQEAIARAQRAGPGAFALLL